MKFSIKDQKDKEKEIEFSLTIDHDGDLVLRANGWIVLWIRQNNGKLLRNIGLRDSDVSRLFSLDKNGGIEYN